MDRPAWSEQFEPNALPSFTPLALPTPITSDWAYAGTGRGVKVAVVDSGVDAGHPWVGTVAGGVALEYDRDAPGLVRTDPGPHDDLFGHGTACAGVIRKYAPECAIYSVRVLGRRLTGKGFVLAAGLRWAIDNGMHVVNLSLSTSNRDYFATLHELVDDAYFSRVMLVSAVSNTSTESFPSLYSSVFSVAARPESGPDGFAYNPRPPVEFGAAGIDVDIAWLDGSVINATGNSFAAPVITGYIARILSAHPHLTPFEMKTVLAALADNIQPDNDS